MEHFEEGSKVNRHYYNVCRHAYAKRSLMITAGEEDAALDFLGLSKHAEKGQWEPKPAVDHLGLLIDSEPKRHQFKTTAKFLAKIKRAAADLIGAAMRNRRLVNDRKLRSFCASVVWCRANI